MDKNRNLSVSILVDYNHVLIVSPQHFPFRLKCAFEADGFTLVSDITNNTVHVQLFRLIRDVSDESMVLMDIDDSIGWLEKLKEELNR